MSADILLLHKTWPVQLQPLLPGNTSVSERHDLNLISVLAPSRLVQCCRRGGTSAVSTLGQHGPNLGEDSCALSQVRPRVEGIVCWLPVQELLQLGQGRCRYRLLPHVHWLMRLL